MEISSSIMEIHNLTYLLIFITELRNYFTNLELSNLSNILTLSPIWIIICETVFPMPVERWPPWICINAFAHKCLTLMFRLLVVLQNSPASKWNITSLTFIWFDTRARLLMLCQTRLVVILPVAFFTLMHRRLSVSAHVSHEMLCI